MQVRPSRARTATASLLLIVLAAVPCGAITNLFFEDFEGLNLLPPVDEGFLTPIFPNAFTNDPPPGWNVDNSGVPLFGSPSVGTEEWQGWSFANKDFWVAAAVGPPPGGPAGGREFFDLGQGTIAVADPDQWNDEGDPANGEGFFTSLLQTPLIDLRPVRPFEDRLVLQFDTSWIPGPCCNDFGAPGPDDNNTDNQTAVIRVRLPNNELVEVLRWESAPFLDELGNPSNTDTGIPNPNFQPPLLNERHVVDLSFLLDAPPNSQPGDDPPGESDLALAIAAASAGGAAGAGLEFSLENAGDDGAWGIDNVEVSSFTTLLGDMNLSGVLESGDIDAFALGMRDEISYLFTYYGEAPADRGSLDSVFDFDDIPWFVGVLETAGVSSASVALAKAIAGVPEPSAATIILLAAVAMGSIRGRSSR